MTTKHYLNQVTWLNRRIQNKLTEIYQLRTMITSASSMPIDNDKVVKSKRTDLLGDTIAKIVDKEREVDDLVDKYIEKRDLIIQQIDSMDDMDVYHVLSLRYVAGRTLEEIHDETGWSLRHVNRIHGKAIAMFEKMYGDTYK